MGRPVKCRISREGAIRAALEIIDEGGLDNFSIEAVARKLGVKGPSLYYHFKDKAALLAEVAKFVLLETKPTVADDATWDEALIAQSVANRRSYLKHPNATALLLQFFPRQMLPMAFDRWARLCPLRPETHMMLIEGMEKLTCGTALFESAAMTRHTEVMPEVDPNRLPSLARAVETNPYEGEELFVEMLRTYLDGCIARNSGQVHPIRARQSGAVSVAPQ